MELPATLPGSLREQLMALLPYAVGRTIGFGERGVGMNELSITFCIPDEAVLDANINRQALKQYGIELDMWRDGPSCDYNVVGPVAKMPPNHTNVVLTIKY